MAFGLVVLLLTVGLLPAAVWERAFIGLMAASPRTEDLLIYAVYRGELGTVTAFVAHGVPVS